MCISRVSQALWVCHQKECSILSQIKLVKFWIFGLISDCRQLLTLTLFLVESVCKFHILFIHQRILLWNLFTVKDSPLFPLSHSFLSFSLSTPPLLFPTLQNPLGCLLMPFCLPETMTEIMTILTFVSSPCFLQSLSTYSQLDVLTLWKWNHVLVNLIV